MRKGDACGQSTHTSFSGTKPSITGQLHSQPGRCLASCPHSRCHTVAQPPHTLEASTEIPLSYILTVVKGQRSSVGVPEVEETSKDPKARREFRARLQLTSPDEQAVTVLQLQASPLTWPLGSSVTSSSDGKALLGLGFSLSDSCLFFSVSCSVFLLLFVCKCICLQNPLPTWELHIRSA